MLGSELLIVGQSQHVLRTRLVVQHLGNDELPPGIILFTSVEVAVVSSTKNVSDTPNKDQVVVYLVKLNEIQVKE